MQDRATAPVKRTAGRTWQTSGTPPGIIVAVWLFGPVFKSLPDQRDCFATKAGWLYAIIDFLSASSWNHSRRAARPGALVK